MRERMIRWLPAIAWMAFIFAMSSREQFPATPGISSSLLAVIAHLVLYGTLALLILLAVSRDERPMRSTLVMVVALTALYGLSDEFHQSFVPGRHPSAFDLVVNTIGATLAVLAWTHRRAIVGVVVSR